MKKSDSIGKFLEIPMIECRISKHHFTNVLSNMDRHLTDWKVNTLSLAGHITLAKTVLSLLLVHLM